MGGETIINMRSSFGFERSDRTISSTALRLITMVKEKFPYTSRETI